jgi:hypothetical protein
MAALLVRTVFRAHRSGNESEAFGGVFTDDKKAGTFMSREEVADKLEALSDRDLQGSPLSINWIKQAVRTYFIAAAEENVRRESDANSCQDLIHEEMPAHCHIPVVTTPTKRQNTAGSTSTHPPRHAADRSKGWWYDIFRGRRGTNQPRHSSK